jgi:hypothetical protein
MLRKTKVSKSRRRSRVVKSRRRRRLAKSRRRNKVTKSRTVSKKLDGNRVLVIDKFYTFADEAGKRFYGKYTGGNEDNKSCFTKLIYVINIGEGRVEYVKPLETLKKCTITQDFLPVEEADFNTLYGISLDRPFITVI